MHITDTLGVSNQLQEKGFTKNEADAIATTTENAMKNIINIIDKKFDNIQNEIKTLKWTILYSIAFLTLFISILAITNSI